MIRKRVFVHRYKPPRKVFLKVVDEDDNIIFEREVDGNELVDVLIVKIPKPLICSQRKVSEDYYVMECKIEEDMSELAAYIL